MRSNHPKTTLTLIRGKTVFHKTSPWFQKLWGTTALKHKSDRMGVNFVH